MGNTNNYEQLLAINESLLSINAHLEASTLMYSKIVNSLEKIEHLMKRTVKDVLTIDEVSGEWEISLSTLYYLVQRDMIPYRKMGKHVRFHRDVIRKWFEDGPNMSVSAPVPSRRISKTQKKKNTTPTANSNILGTRAISQAVAQHYGEHLSSYHWNGFATFTTTYPLNGKKARTIITNFFKLLSEQYPLSLFWVSEKFPDRQGVHIHALLNFFDPSELDLKMQRALIIWNSVAEGKYKFSRTLIELFNPELDGIFYLTNKLRQKNVDYDYYGLQQVNDSTTHVNADKAA